MSVFVLADPHLSMSADKPMGVFGQHWLDHDLRLHDRWQEIVRPADVVLLPGDISWAMYLEEALPDLRYLHALNGQKYILRGNHDYWWSSLSKMESLCLEEGLHTLHFIRHEAFMVREDHLICGTRGWLLPDDPEFTAADRKIYLREIERLRLSLESARKQRLPGQTLTVCLHFPPLTRDLKGSAFTDLMKSYAVDTCVFGHIHRSGSPLALHGEQIEGISYWLTAADHLNFTPLLLYV